MTPTNVRYHGGVDIEECSLTNLRNVFSILAGNRQTPTVCVGGLTCVRIRDSATHAFDYEHINISTSLTTSSTVTIPAGTLLGTVRTNFTLHLQESVGIAGTAYRFNPQRPNALDFDHSGSPTFTLTSITGASNQSIILLPESSTYPEGLQTNPTAFQYRNGTYYVKGNVAVLVAASGGSGGTSDRKGVFAAGYVLSPAAKTPSSYNIAFMQLPDGPTNTNDYWTTYLSSNPTGITHIASNMKLNGVGVETINATWDTTDYREGPAQICGFIKDFPAGHINQSACTNGVVHNAAPTITLLDQNGSVITYASSMTMVSVVGTDSVDGVEKITLLKPNQTTSTQTFSGVVQSATATFSGLTDGQYLATVYHLAGSQQVARQAFIIAAADPSADARDDKDGPIVDVIPSSRCLVIHARDTVAGIASISISGAGLSKTMSFPCGVPARSTDVYAGAFCSLTENSTYTGTVPVVVEN